MKCRSGFQNVASTLTYTHSFVSLKILNLRSFLSLSNEIAVLVYA